MNAFLQALDQWIWHLGVVVAALVAGLVVHKLVFVAAQRAAQRSRREGDDLLVRYSRAPARLLLPLLAVVLVLPSLALSARIAEPIDRLLAVALIAGVAWLLVRLLQVFEEMIDRKYRLDENEDVSVRRIRTQAQVFHRIGVVVVIVVTVAAILMTFPSVRQLGVSLFASAGIAGVVVGIAARPTLSNLIAGMQVALTQPVRIDDVVVVEGEWGHIEEIATTYVVVRIWDKRRLVLPLTYFIEKPFQNWTRSSTEILGTVFVYTDYTVPVEAVRTELKRILDATALWNGTVWGLQVTDTTEHSVQLRALMSAADSGSAWDLRCHVREALIDFLQGSHPQALPKTRAELHRDA